MYGGSHAPADLWKFDVTADKWTWVLGDTTLNLGGGTTPVTGTKGIPSIFNTPGSRNGTPSWTGTDGSLWLFGGFFGGGSKRNDLWRYVFDTIPGSCNFVGIDEIESPFSSCIMYNSATDKTCMLECNVTKPEQCSIVL
jgi:hypothetical protein